MDQAAGFRWPTMLVALVLAILGAMGLAWLIVAPLLHRKHL